MEDPRNMLSVVRFCQLNGDTARKLMATSAWDAVEVENPELSETRIIHITHVQNFKR